MENVKLYHLKTNFAFFDCLLNDNGSNPHNFKKTKDGYDTEKMLSIFAEVRIY